MSASIEADHLLPYPPARVWTALTDSACLARWLMPNTLGEAVVGHAFTFDVGAWGTVRCTLLDVVPERRLSMSWVNPPLDTVLTYTLTPEGAGTRLHVEHAGFDLADPRQAAAFAAMGEGWRDKVLHRLGDALEAG